MGGTLERFVDAQNAAGAYRAALGELERGRKESHWMWFVFPQMAGLGTSAMARAYGIESLAAARDYLGHPVLGDRLRRCAQVVADAVADSAESIFGGLDACKLRSSMTLFHRADPTEPAFVRVLERFFGGEPDPRTDELLRRGHGAP
jgi:uncharacterized protein (DUF1810 family)